MQNILNSIYMSMATCCFQFQFTTWPKHCSDRFTQPNQLKTHLLKSHNEGTWLSCIICQKNFSQSDHLKKHLLRHKGVKPYACNDCPKCFCTTTELRRHQSVHAVVKQFCCGLCGKDFKCKVSVVNHFKKCFDKLGCDNDICTQQSERIQMKCIQMIDSVCRYAAIFVPLMAIRISLTFMHIMPQFCSYSTVTLAIGTD